MTDLLAPLGGGYKILAMRNFVALYVILGAMALNDIWFGGQTMNPWLLEEGASGSSAGPGAATAAGLVVTAFSRRNGVRRTEAGIEEVRCPHCKRPRPLTPWWHPFGTAVPFDAEESPGRRKCGNCGGIYDFNG